MQTQWVAQSHPPFDVKGQLQLHMVTHHKIIVSIVMANKLGEFNSFFAEEKAFSCLDPQNQ